MDIYNKFQTIADLANLSWISSDIFDTLLVRNGRCEAERFLDAAKICARNTKIKHISTNDIWLARLMAHNRCYRLRQSLFNYKEPNLHNIILATSLILGLKDKDNINFIHSALSSEFETECNGLHINSDVLQTLVSVKQEHKLKLILLSDMYLPKSFLEKIIVNFFKEEYALFDHIFVSNELGAQKMDGTAYAKISLEFNCLPKRFLHVGDNYCSDVVQAKRRGWNALLYEDAVRQQLEALQASRLRIAKEQHKLGIDINKLH